MHRAGDQKFAVQKRQPHALSQNVRSARKKNPTSPLTKQLNLAQLAPAGVHISLLLFPVLKRLLDIVVALDAHVRVLAIQVLELDLPGPERHGRRPLQFRVDAVFERVEADVGADDKDHSAACGGAVDLDFELRGDVGVLLREWRGHVAGFHRGRGQGALATLER
jgi:hypothetical protein